MKSAKACSRLPTDQLRIESAQEALKHFDVLCRRSFHHLDRFDQNSSSGIEMGISRFSGSSNSNSNFHTQRLDSRLLSPAMIERIVRLGGEEELLIREQSLIPVSIRLTTLARLLLQEIPKPVGAAATIAVDSRDYFDQSTISVPLVMEAFRRRQQVFGLSPRDTGVADEALEDSSNREQDDWATRADGSSSNDLFDDDDFGKVIVSSRSVLGQPARAAGIPPSKASVPVVVAAPPKPLPGAIELVKLSVVQERLATLEAGGIKGNEMMISPLRALKARPWRQPAMVGLDTIGALASLKQDFPNFLPLVERYEAEMQLKRLVGAPLVFRPTLLVGPSGIGKTAFMRRFSEVMPMETAPCAVATLSSGWILNGKSSGWQGCGMGLVAQGMIHLPEGRGLMLWLDEVDKLSSITANATVLPVLLELLEPLSSQTFRDEYLELPMNLVPFLSVLATANDLANISAPLLSRFQVVKVEAPTASQMDAVIRSVDRCMRAEMPALATVFAPLGDDVRAALGTLAPRQAYQVLDGAYSVAAARSETGAEGVQITVADVQQALRVVEAGKSVVKPATSAGTGTEEVMGAVLFRIPSGGGGNEGGNGGGGGPASGGSGVGGRRTH